MAFEIIQEASAAEIIHVLNLQLRIYDKVVTPEKGRIYTRLIFDFVFVILTCC